MTDGTREFGPRPPARPVPRAAAAPPRRAPWAVAAVAVLLAVAGWLVTRDRPSRAAAPPPAAADWGEVVRGLDAHRAAAFATGEPERLAQVYAADCPCLAADTALLRTYGRARGLRHEVLSARALEEDAGRVTLLVVDRMPAYEVSGRRHAGRPEATWTVELVRTPDGWRIAGLERGARATPVRASAGGPGSRDPT